MRPAGGQSRGAAQTGRGSWAIRARAPRAVRTASRAHILTVPVYGIQ